MSDNGQPRISIVEYGTKPADQFQANPRNPRRHPQRQRDAVHDSLERVGWIAPVIENRQTGNLLDGHERVWQALATNSDVPYVVVDVAEADEAFVLATFDPIGALAEIDAAAFADVLRDVDTGSAAIQEMLAAMAEEAGIDWGQLAEPEEPPEPQIDRAEELREIWQTERGQVWEIASKTVPGKSHRVMCGDSTKAEDVARLMGGEKAGMIQTDPPYGVAYSGQTETMFYGENKKGRARRDLVNDATPEAARAIIAGALLLHVAPVAFVWCSPQYHDLEKQAVREAGYSVFALIVWNKNHANYGAMGARYKPKYEMAIACKRDKIPWYGPDNEVTVWDIDRAVANEFHPTQKPVELFSRAIRNHTTAGALVYDPFIGGGASVVSSEQLGRVCFGCDIAPGYVAVTLQRLSDMGLEPRLAV